MSNQNGEAENVSETESEETSTEEESTGSEETSWISWFCSLEGNEFFCKVSEDFICDSFNLTGLSVAVPYYNDALELILDVEPDEEYFTDANLSMIQSSAELLYGLIHQRYILTKPGLSQMGSKYEAGEFGYCPRVLCNRCHVIPICQSDIAGESTVKLFCPKCCDIYTPSSRRHMNIDGAFFGTTMAHLLFHSFPHLQPQPTETIYIPRIYGFKIHTTSPNAPTVQKFLRNIDEQTLQQQQQQQQQLQLQKLMVNEPQDDGGQNDDDD
jgi:casein kinase II subunit beta